MIPTTLKPDNLFYSFLNHEQKVPGDPALPHDILASYDESKGRHPRLCSTRQFSSQRRRTEPHHIHPQHSITSTTRSSSCHNLQLQSHFQDETSTLVIENGLSHKRIRKLRNSTRVLHATIKDNFIDAIGREFADAELLRVDNDTFARCHKVLTKENIFALCTPASIGYGHETVPENLRCIVKFWTVSKPQPDYLFLTTSISLAKFIAFDLRLDILKLKLNIGHEETQDMSAHIQNFLQ